MAYPVYMSNVTAQSEFTGNYHGQDFHGPTPRPSHEDTVRDNDVTTHVSDLMQHTLTRKGVKTKLHYWYIVGASLKM